MIAALLRTGLSDARDSTKAGQRERMEKSECNPWEAP